MRANGKTLKGQLQRAEKEGWVQMCAEIGKEFTIDPALLLAIGSRETNLNPQYLKEPGDRGNGFGLTQADRRSFPEFVNSGKWKDPYECFRFTAERIKSELYNLRLYEKQETVAGKFRSGRGYSFTPKPLPDEMTRLRIVVAGYNCGLKTAYYHYCKSGNNADKGTTGADYSKDVFDRCKQFKSLAENEGIGKAILIGAAVASAGIVAGKVALSNDFAMDNLSLDSLNAAAGKAVAVKSWIKRGVGSLISAYTAIESFVETLSTSQKIALSVILAVILFLGFHFRHKFNPVLNIIFRR